MFALVDCNNFYCSCERVFDPKLADRPVVVLSNNDGCAIARNKEAKALGIKMGAPFFQIEKELRVAGGVARSSNFPLYADQSNRVMAILSEYSPEQEVYSIDECFLGMSGFTGLSSIGQDIRARILNWTGLPVCVGFGPSKTLSKLANHVAKKNPEWNSVCDLSALSTIEQDALIGDIEVGEVWGVGRRSSARLEDMGITTVRQLRDANPARIRQAFSVVLERTVQELRGVSCLALEDVIPAKQQIMVSRSFGNPVYDLPDLRQAVGSFIARAAEKLRHQRSCAGAVMVFIRTSPFRTQEPQYSRSVTVPIAEATDDTLQLTQAALSGLTGIYRPGYSYAKAGVMLLELCGKSRVPTDLFSDLEQRTKSTALMATLDKVNAKFGRGALTTAITLSAANNPAPFKMRQDRKSPAYTTQWDGLIRIRG